MTTRSSGTSWEEWTVVASGSCRRRAELAEDAGLQVGEAGALAGAAAGRVTATQPTTQKSSRGISSNPTGSPCAT
jgi:hypothetical protein